MPWEYLQVMRKSIDFQACNYMFKVNKRNTRTKCEICSKLTIKTTERRQISSVNVTKYQKTSISQSPIFPGTHKDIINIKLTFFSSLFVFPLY